MSELVTGTFSLTLTEEPRVYQLALYLQGGGQSAPTYVDAMAQGLRNEPWYRGAIRFQNQPAISTRDDMPGWLIIDAKPDADMLEVLESVMSVLDKVLGVDVIYEYIMTSQIYLGVEKWAAKGPLNNRDDVRRAAKDLVEPITNRSL